MQLIERRYLAIYLNDHLAGATGGLELARRSHSSNEGSELGDFLGTLVTQISDERERLREIMDFLGVTEDRAKQALAWGGEKLGRLKLNGALVSYSPLSRIAELEGPYLGVSGKRAGWLNLQRSLGEHLARFDLEGLIANADEQRERLEQFRLELVQDVLGDHPEAASA